MILDWAEAGMDLGPDTALEEYKQHLWIIARETRNRQDRAILLREIERLNEKGRAALRDSLTAD